MADRNFQDLNFFGGNCNSDFDPELAAISSDVDDSVGFVVDRVNMRITKEGDKLISSKIGGIEASPTYITNTKYPNTDYTYFRCIGSIVSNGRKISCWANIGGADAQQTTNPPYTSQVPSSIIVIDNYVK